jgi:tripartite-type tricarboxylate transporter receptor subunit TctC
LIAGQVDLMFDGLGSSANHIKGGRLRGIAVASDKRAPGFPDLPTVREAGLADYEVATWYGIFANKGTPRDVVTAMQNEMRKALTSDELKASWNGLGAETPTLWGDAYGSFVANEIKRWAGVVKSSGAKLD